MRRAVALRQVPPRAYVTTIPWRLVAAAFPGVSLIGTQRAVPYSSHRGAEFYGKFKGFGEAACMGGEVREISGQWASRGKILQPRANLAEHFLLLGKTAENGIGDSAVVRRSGGPATARFGDSYGEQ